MIRLIERGESILINYLGTQILGDVKKLGKRQFIIITGKYLIVGKYPMDPQYLSIFTNNGQCSMVG